MFRRWWYENDRGVMVIAGAALIVGYTSGGLDRWSVIVGGGLVILATILLAPDRR